jgi:hypothetical protein
MSTSNSYVFGTNTQIDQFFREAFERVGIEGNKISQPLVTSAQMSANLALSSWMGKGPNTWMRKRGLINLYSNQSTYQLPTNITYIVDVIAIQPYRLNSDGFAISSTVAAGSASNVFDPYATAGCTLATTNGYIGYDYGTSVSNSIFYVGVQALNNNSSYTLAVDYSFDGINWITIYNGQTVIYNSNQIIWIVVENALNAQYWRIRETKNAILSINQLYFSQPVNNGQGDRALSAYSYTEYMQIANKQTPSSGAGSSAASGYFFNSQINPYIALYPVPNGTYSGLLYTAYFYPQDVTNLFNEFDLPQRFLDAMVADLAYRLASKPVIFKLTNTEMDPNLILRLQQDRDQAFNLAAITDESNFTLKMTPDFNYLGK